MTSTDNTVPAGDNTVLAMQQVQNFQNERDTWRTLLHKQGREFSVFGQNLTINGKNFKDLTAANASFTAKELLAIFLNDKLKMSTFHGQLEAASHKFTAGISRLKKYFFFYSEKCPTKTHLNCFFLCFLKKYSEQKFCCFL